MARTGRPAGTQQASHQPSSQNRPEREARAGRERLDELARTTAENKRKIEQEESRQLELEMEMEVERKKANKAGAKGTNGKRSGSLSNGGLPLFKPLPRETYELQSRYTPIVRRRSSLSLDLDLDTPGPSTPRKRTPKRKTRRDDDDDSRDGEYTDPPKRSAKVSGAPVNSGAGSTLEQTRETLRKPRNSQPKAPQSRVRINAEAGPSTPIRRSPRKAGTFDSPISIPPDSSQVTVPAYMGSCITVTRRDSSPLSSAPDSPTTTPRDLSLYLDAERDQAGSRFFQLQEERRRAEEIAANAVPA